MTGARGSLYNRGMVRLVIIGLLALSVVCLMPLMGGAHAASGHAHHGTPASCGACAGPTSLVEDVVRFALVGFSAVPGLRLAPPAPLPAPFHPPRAS